MAGTAAVQEATPSGAVFSPSNKPKNSERFKIVLLGDQGVGKTSVIIRYLNDSFSESYTVPSPPP